MLLSLRASSLLDVGGPHIVLSLLSGNYMPKTGLKWQYRAKLPA